MFNALLGGDDPQGGFMDVVVAGAKERPPALPAQHGDPGDRRSTAPAARVRMVDFAPRFRRFGRMFRPPMLVRRLEPVAGRPRVTHRLRPTFDYGSLKPQIT